MNIQKIPHFVELNKSHPRRHYLIPKPISLELSILASAFYCRDRFQRIHTSNEDR